MNVGFVNLAHYFFASVLERGLERLFLLLLWVVLLLYFLQLNIDLFLKFLIAYGFLKLIFTLWFFVLSVPLNFKSEELKTSSKLEQILWICLEKCAAKKKKRETKKNKNPAVTKLYTMAFIGKVSHHVHMGKKKKAKRTCYIVLMM